MGDNLNYHSFISRGAYGEVFKCIRDDSDFFALKSQIINREIGVSGVIIREIDILSRINHPNIITIQNVWLDDLSVNMELPFYPKTLIQFAHRNHTNIISGEILQSIVYYLLDALRFIHSNKLIHCDIKPENILVNHSDDKLSLALIDFGLTISPGGTRYELCTITYRPPELFFSDNDIYHTEKVDIWALGVTLYYIVSRKRIVEDSDPEGEIPGIIFQKCGLNEEFRKEFPAAMWYDKSPSTFEDNLQCLPNNELFVDLLKHMLDINPHTRWNANQLLGHPFLNKYTQPQPANIREIQALPVKVHSFHKYKRSEIIQNIRDISQKFSADHNAIILAIHIFDKFLEKVSKLKRYKNVPPQGCPYKILALTCASIGLNYIEGSILEIQALVDEGLPIFGKMHFPYLCFSSYDEIFKLQKQIITVLNWNIGYTTLHDVVSDKTNINPFIEKIYQALSNVNLINGKTLEELANIVISQDPIPECNISDVLSGNDSDDNVSDTVSDDSFSDSNISDDEVFLSDSELISHSEMFSDIKICD
jgi:serine/threonine protein kinase